jgi:hypothetical protein
VLRLRYQGNADRWLIAIYKASSESWSGSELRLLLSLAPPAPAGRGDPRLSRVHRRPPAPRS